MENNKVYVLSDYNFVPGVLVKTNKTTYTVRFRGGFGLIEQVSRVKKEKVVFPDEIVAVVWERWKGVNGAGAHRVERELYPQWRIPASQVAYQGMSGDGRIIEEVYAQGRKL